MTFTHRLAPTEDPNRVGHLDAETAEHPHRGASGPASKRIVVAYGFWVFLLSDIVMFSTFFASFAVLAQDTAGGPHGSQLFDLSSVALETAFLLISSFFCGLASLAAAAHSARWFYLAMTVTFIFGAGFLTLEAREFAGMVAIGADAQRSAFLTAFFTLVGCHGIHVTAGLMWLLTMMAQIFAKGFRADILRRMLCFALFWHALDIIWVAIFTVVYLMGMAR